MQKMRKFFVVSSNHKQAQKARRKIDPQRATAQEEQVKNRFFKKLVETIRTL
jgi:hypothetical protein